jgi:hypothetical protein
MARRIELPAICSYLRKAWLCSTQHARERDIEVVGVDQSRIATQPHTFGNVPVAKNPQIGRKIIVFVGHDEKPSKHKSDLIVFFPKNTHKIRIMFKISKNCEK